MSRHRFFLTEQFGAFAPGSVVHAPLSADDVRHATRSLRVRAGEGLDLVEPSGTSWRVRVSAVSEDGLDVELLEALQTSPEPDVTLVFGVLKGSKNDDVIEGAVEVGVRAIVPVLFERSVVRLDAEKRAERGGRWRRVAVAAAKQAKRSQVPHVADPVGFSETVAMLAEYDAVLVAWEEADGEGVSACLEELSLAPDSHVAIVVGPEGGLSASEVAALTGAGARTCTLGPTILRAETAGVIATALVVYGLGGLGNRR